jgi:hypothetical protein
VTLRLLSAEKLPKDQLVQQDQWVLEALLEAEVQEQQGLKEQQEVLVQRAQLAFLEVQEQQVNKVFREQRLLWAELVQRVLKVPPAISVPQVMQVQLE